MPTATDPLDRTIRHARAVGLILDCVTVLAVAYLLARAFVPWTLALLGWR
ncbi:MAG: hypothetical protein FJY95_23080 [Candidatus Handelsmanbacteria bacterium]|nr:hypothetical protein [Candidatus Handelsmanbacteria bacterium]